MTEADVPAWAAIIVVALAVIGSGLSLLGAVGLVRLKTFYERVHAPTLGATLGMAMVLLASIVWFTTVERLDTRLLWWPTHKGFTFGANSGRPTLRSTFVTVSTSTIPPSSALTKRPTKSSLCSSAR